MAVGRPNVTFNPNVIITREKTWQKTLAKVVPQLLIDAHGRLLFKDVEVRVGYLPAGAGFPAEHDYKIFLAVSVMGENSKPGLVSALQTLLNERWATQENRQPVGFSENAFMDISPQMPRGNYCMLYIDHAFLPRFLNEICRGVNLYADNHYSLVRDVYCIAPDAGDPSMARGDVGAFQAIFRDLHQAYGVSQKMQTRLMHLAHRASGADHGASLFKKIHPAASSKDELYERLNALVHAYHLNEDERIQGFSNRLTDEAERTRLVDVYGDNFLTLVHDGDMFYEISEIFKQSPDAKVAYVSPDNLFRCGSGALLGGRGSVEESLARVSNYVPKALAQAQLDSSDPQFVLYQLYLSLQPMGGKVPLSAACGVYYLAGQEIPEYINREDVNAYAEYAYERLHLAREMAKVKGDDNYAKHKTMPHLVPDVNFLDAQGVVRKVSVVGMVGIDGRSHRSGSVASQLGFEDSDLQDQHGFNAQGQYDILKTINFYKEQWCFAFDEILHDQYQDTIFVLNPVGSGVFDPSKDGSRFTRASAQGFAEALQSKRDDLRRHGVTLVLPIYDMRKVYPHYSQALFACLRVKPTRACIGGSEQSCLLAIRNESLALKGGKFDIEQASLEAILAHAVEKPGKTRHVLLALGYLEINAKNALVLSDLAPGPVRVAYERIQAADGELRVKERIIAEYKKARGWLYKQSEGKADGFNIFTADLTGIIEHAIEKDGNTRLALMNLGYVDVLMKANTVVLSDNNRNIPQIFREKFDEVKGRQPQNPQPQ